MDSVKSFYTLDFVNSPYAKDSASSFYDEIDHENQYECQSLASAADSPAKVQAKEIFWGLKDDFWKQIIDGVYHEYDHLVFDNGLHNGCVEPGFFNSLKMGCEYASDHLTEKLSIEFYKELNKNLCSHFNGRKNCTEMLAQDAGKFKANGVMCYPPFGGMSSAHRENYFIAKLFKKYPLVPEDSDQECQRYIDKFLMTWNKPSAQWVKKHVEIKNNIAETLLNRLPDAKAWVKKNEREWDDKILLINQDVEKIEKEFNVPKFVSLKKPVKSDCLVVDYLCVNPTEQEKVVNQLFDRYNQKIEVINSKSKVGPSSQEEELKQEKVEAIGNLYQALEWLHPFKDGQGRTDLVLQAKLLSEEGLNPAILEEPYTSTWSTSKEWNNYLSHGMEKWRAEKARIENRISRSS